MCLGVVDCCMPADAACYTGDCRAQDPEGRVAKAARGTVGSLVFGTVPEMLSSAERAFSAVLFACLSTLR